MSHIATYRSTLTGVDPAMIQAAFAAVLQAHVAQGWEATDRVYDYVMRNPTRCLAGVITRGKQPYPYGVGVNVDDAGNLQYVGDLSMQRWQDVRQELENYYLALGYMQCGEASVEINEAQQPTDVQIALEIQF